MIDPLWLTAFLLTLGVEVPLTAFLAPRGQRRFLAGVAAVVQLLTHPLAWLAVVEWHLGWWGVEAAVCVLEAAVYAVASGRALRAAGLSLLANAASAGAGVLLLAP